MRRVAAIVATAEFAGVAGAVVFEVVGGEVYLLL